MIRFLLIASVLVLGLVNEASAFGGRRHGGSCGYSYNYYSTPCYQTSYYTPTYYEAPVSYCPPPQPVVFVQPASVPVVQLVPVTTQQTVLVPSFSYTRSHCVFGF